MAGVDAEVDAAAATLLLTTTAAAALEDDELVLLALETVLAFEVTLELVLVLRVVGVAEELIFGVLETLLKAEETALELAFVVGVAEGVAEELAFGVLRTLPKAEEAALELAFALRLGATVEEKVA